jgi:hypothetical protein
MAGSDCTCAPRVEGGPERTGTNGKDRKEGPETKNAGRGAPAKQKSQVTSTWPDERYWICNRLSRLF